MHAPFVTPDFNVEVLGSATLRMCKILSIGWGVQLWAMQSHSNVKPGEGEGRGPCAVGRQIPAQHVQDFVHQLSFGDVDMVCYIAVWGWAPDGRVRMSGGWVGVAVWL